MNEATSTIKSRHAIGKVLVDSGRLSQEDLELILAFQRSHGSRLGDIGKSLGFLNEDDVRFALQTQFDYLKGSRAADVWLQHWTQLVEKIERVHSSADEQLLLLRLSHPQRPFVLAFANAHAMNSLATSSPFFEALHSADVVLRDGSGMAALFKLFGLAPGLNLNGTDLIPSLIPHFDGRCIALFGTQNPYLTRGMQAMKQTLAPRSEFVSENGFLDVQSYVMLALEHRPALIILGMGMPKQEEVASVLRAALPFACLIVCGGAIIDFFGGKTPRSPVWMRKTGMEWLFRLAMEPRRLFQRYVIGNPLFLKRAVTLASMSRR